MGSRVGTGKTVGPGPSWSLPRHLHAAPLDDRAFCLSVFEVDCPKFDYSTTWTGDWHGHLIVQRSRVRSLRKVGVLISEGAPPKGIYAALKGRVRAIRCAGDADEIHVYVGEAGFWVGKFAVLARLPSISSVVAHSAVRTPFLPAAEFERIVGDEPRYFRAFADLSFERHALLFRHLVEARGLAPKGRLRTRLVDLAAMPRCEPSRGCFSGG